MRVFEHDLFLLFVDYEEGDAGNGTGQVYRTDASRAPDLVPILNSNDALRRLWASPSEALWVASENGHVHTSAAVNWPGKRFFTTKTPRHQDALNGYDDFHHGVHGEHRGFFKWFAPWSPCPPW